MSTGTDPGEAAGWFERLEAQLEQQLEAFLAANPAQEALLREQEQQERQQRLKRRRLELRGQAEQARAGLLQLAAEIAEWQRRVERARAAGASDLAARADQHLHGLMAQGRDRWQALGELGSQFRQVEQELDALAQAAASQAQGNPQAEGASTDRSQPDRAQADRAQSDPADLEQAWARFEAEQELEQLRRRQG
ncbi:hercynine metabolism protein [Vulcanococcus limneticus]|uniref:hercynine metabolism protein n=1 Tax=Vulcanococcus limneticus TaxID=2170428 RepID=UPI00398BBD30